MPTPTTPRPKRSEQAVINAAAFKLAPSVISWMQQAGEYDEDTDTVESIAELLADNMKWDSDGYAIAKNLDGDLSPDAALVEILDCADNHIRKAHGEVVKAWLATSGLTPPLVGAKVREPKGHPEHRNLVGTVVSNYENQGQATVAFAELGHGVQKGGVTTTGLIINWEDLEVVPGETSAPTA